MDINVLWAQLAALQRDFQYNLRLLDGRDAELGRAEEQAAAAARREEEQAAALKRSEAALAQAAAGGAAPQPSLNRSQQSAAPPGWADDRQDQPFKI